MNDRKMATGVVGVFLGIWLALVVWIVFMSAADAAGPPWCFPLSEDARVTYADGDSFNTKLLIYPFPKVEMTALVRINGIDTPELNGKTACERKAAQESTDIVLKFLELPSVLVCIEGKDKYGRPLASVYSGETDLRQLLINSGLARPYSGGKRGPWCEDGAK